MIKTGTALTTAGALIAGTAAATLMVAPAQADGPEREASGQVAGASYDIGAEKEGRFEIDADLEGVAAGSTWKMVVRHDGTKVATRTAKAVSDDGSYEVDFRDVRSANTAGKDTFKVTLDRVGGPGKVTRTLTFAR